MADLELAAEFWEQLIHTLGPEDSWYYGFSPKRKGATLKRSAIEHTTGVNGVKLCFRWRANEIHATVTIEDLGIERINNYMNQIKFLAIILVQLPIQFLELKAVGVVYLETIF